MSVVSYLKLLPKREFEEQFHSEMEELLGLVCQQKGFISVEVLRPDERYADPSATEGCVILSEWESEADFKEWEHSTRHEEIMGNYNRSMGHGYTRMRMNRYR